VHVRVGEGREQVLAGAVDGGRSRGRLHAVGRRDLGDLPVAHEHVVRAVELGAGVEHVRGADQQLRGVERCRVQLGGGIDAHATASRLGEPTSSS
jgi:hypothetical protein